MNWLEKIADSLIESKELQFIINKWKTNIPQLVLYVYETEKRVVLSSLIIPNKLRKQGLGSQIMTDLTNYADQVGKRMELSPGVKDSYTGTTSINRLIKFYKRFGFFRNRGRYKDYSTSETMLRNPQKNLEIVPDTEVV